MKHLILFLVSGIWLLTSPIAPAIIDANANGVSDLWEKAHNNGQLLPQTFDPQADPDGDGWTNAWEAAAGTDPGDANAPSGILCPDIACVPAVMGTDGGGQPIVITPESVVISWTTLPGKQYTLLYSPDLSANSWLPVGEPFIGMGYICEFGFPNADADLIFLRVAVTDLDSDLDGLTNSEEFALGTIAALADSDGDGSNDFDEIANATLPLIRDTDGDGVLDGDEARAGTDPLLAEDLDDDDMPDDWEKFMSASLLEIFPDPVHWGTRYAHLASHDLEPGQCYTSDGITASEACAVMANTDDAEAGEGIQFEWQEKSEYMHGSYDPVNEPPYRGGGDSSSPEWSQRYVSSSYDDGSSLSSVGLLSRHSALAWAPVSVRDGPGGNYKPLFSAFPREPYPPEYIAQLGIHAYSNFYTSPEDTDGSYSNGGAKKSFRVRLASRRPVGQKVVANWLRIKYTGFFNSSIDLDQLQEVSAEQMEIVKGGMFSGWMAADPALPAASTGLGDANNETLIPSELKVAWGNHEIPPTKEDGDGAWALLNFDDDDNDGGPWGDGQTTLKGDLDDVDEVTGENDLLRLGMRGVREAGVRQRLKFDPTHIRIWKTESKGGDAEKVVSELTDFDATVATWTVWHVEGIKPHDDDQGTIVTLQEKWPGKGWVDGDSVKIRVAHPVVVVYGDGDLWNGDDKQELNGFLSERVGTDPTRIRRTFAGSGTTYLIGGKSQDGHDVCYSVTPLSANATPTTPALAEKWLKLALQTPNTHICLTGHCNYGVGLALGSNFTRMDQFFNSSAGGCASISRTHFGAEHHDPLAVQSSNNFQWRPAVIADRNAIAAVNPENRMLQGAGILPNVGRYPHVGSPVPAGNNTWATQNSPWANMDAGGNITLQGHIKWHYIADPDLDGNGANDEHSILQTGNADVPANLQYRSLMLNQCNTYRSLLESFLHGTVISSWATVSSTQSTRTYVQGLLDGWSWTKMDEELDDQEEDSGSDGDPRYPSYKAFHVTSF